ncbi:MAG: hypothetical protein Q8N26_07735 [Myxococcales bacterium]|nr:hypothetical protein [Myxococcales bacterium]
MRKLLGYLVALGVFAALYAVVMFGPLWLDHFSAKDLVNSTFNQFRELGPDQFKAELLRKLNLVDWATHQEQDEEGRMKDVQGLGLTEDDVFVEFDDRTKILWVKVNYTRRVVLKPTEKVRVFKFSVERKEKPPNVY